MKNSWQQDAIQDCIENCENFDEFVKDCKREARDYFEDCTGETPIDEDDLVEFMRECWDDFNS